MTCLYDKVKSTLIYSPETGIFIWKKSGKIAGGLNSKGYHRISIEGQSIKSHRLAFLITTGSMPTEDIDHIDGNRSNNRWVNLRVATRTENLQNAIFNKPINAHSALIGVSKSGESRWKARIKHNSKLIHLGTFKTQKEAHQAYLDAKAKYHSFQPTPRNLKPNQPEVQP